MRSTLISGGFATRQAEHNLRQSYLRFAAFRLIVSLITLTSLVLLALVVGTVGNVWGWVGSTGAVSAAAVPGVPMLPAVAAPHQPNLPQLPNPLNGQFSTGTPTPTPACGLAWAVVSSPNTGSQDNLTAVAVVSSNDIWGVGSYWGGSTAVPLVLHWDGSVWSVVSPGWSPPPFSTLSGVAAVSANDVWVVGGHGIGDGSGTLVGHWNGIAWSIVSSPGPGQWNALNAVAAISANDVWAVGGYTSRIYSYTLVEHWDGSAWNIVGSPDGSPYANSLSGVAAVSANDMWAVGSTCPNLGCNYTQTLVEHWDGSTWTIVPSPNVGTYSDALHAVAAISANDVWAVGSYNNGTIDQTLVEHWHGIPWSVVLSPNVGTHNNDLYGIAAMPVLNGQWWAVGDYIDDAGTSQTLILGPDGVMPSPNVGTHDNTLNGVAAVSANDVWAVGDYSNGTANQTLLERYYDPCAVTPTTTPTTMPTLSAIPSATLTNTDTPAPPANTNTPTPAPTYTSTYTGTNTAVPASPTSSPMSSPTTTSTSTACPIQFTDVPVGSTFYPFVRCLACLGIINGYPDHTFRPNNQVTRGQLSKIVSNSARFSDPQPSQLFQDVPVGSTFQVFVGRLASRGYINGYPCGGPGEPCQPGNLPYFRPGNSATRGQISKIDADASGFSDPPSGQQFEDVAVGSAFYTYTYRLVSRAIMSGYPCGGHGEPCVPPANLPYFRPNNNATRGQTSKIVSNTFFPDCSWRPKGYPANPPVRK